MASGRLQTVSVTTSYAPLADIAGVNNVSISNDTGAAILIRYASDTTATREITLADTKSIGLGVQGNAKELEIKAAAGAAGVNYVAEFIS